MINAKQATLFGLIALAIGFIIVAINLIMIISGNSQVSLWVVAAFFFIASTYFFVAFGNRRTNR